MDQCKQSCLQEMEKLSWLCIGLTVLRDAASCVRSSSEGDFCGRGDFSFGVKMGSDSIPPRTLSDDSMNQSQVCANMHSIAQTQKILTFRS